MEEKKTELKMIKMSEVQSQEIEWLSAMLKANILSVFSIDK